MKVYATGYVLDASVGVKWLAELGEADRKQALAIRAQHVAGLIRLVVPDLFLLEVSNALHFGHRFKEVDVVGAIQAVEDLQMGVYPLDFDLLRKTVAIAHTYQVTVYDAVYVALAEQTGYPLVTADYALVKKMRGNKTILRLCDMRHAS